MRANVGYLFRACSGKGVSHHGCLAWSPRWGGWETSQRAPGAAQVCLGWRWLTWRSCRWVYWGWASYVMGLGHIFGSLLGPELEAEVIKREAGRSGPRWDLLGPTVAEACFGFCGLVATRCGPEFSHCIWSSCCLFVYSISQNKILFLGVGNCVIS